MRDVKLWCSTSSQVNCTRSNSLVLYFLMPVMIDLVSIFSSEQYLAIMNPPESSLVLVTAGLEWPLLHSDFSLTVFNSWVCVVWKCKCFKLVWEVHLGFLQLQQFPPVKSLTAGLGCATLTAVEPQKDSVTPCCSLTSSAYNAFSITIPSAGFPSRLVMDVLLFACIKAERIYLNALSQGSSLSYIFSPLLSVSNFWIWILCPEIWTSSYIMFRKQLRLLICFVLKYYLIIYCLATKVSLLGFFHSNN